MKRLTCLALAMLLALSGCTEVTDEHPPSSDRLIVTYQTMPYSRLDGLSRIQAAVNAIAKEEAGVEVEFLTIDAQESFDAYPLWLSQGKRIDLMMLNYQNIQSYAKSGHLLPLDSLLEQHGGGIRALMETCDLTSGTALDGSIYGLRPPADASGLGGGLWIPVRYLEKAGFPFEAEKIYSQEELEDLLARLKEKYPDKYPLGQLTSGGTFSTYSYFYGMQNPFGDGGASGSLDAETGHIVNFYTTEEYHAFLRQLRRWYQLGYICPDAAYTGFSNVELLKSGEILSIPLISRPGIFLEEQVGEPVVCLRLSELHSTGGSPQGVFWVIPSTCGDPEGAIKFLDLMYTDQRVVNFLAWGEEGIDYCFLDEAEGVVTYPEGVNQENAGYYNPLGLYGDMRKAYSLNDNTLKKELERYAAQATPIGPEYLGFVFDESPVATETWQIREVLTRYLPVMEAGCVELEENYAAFLDALDDAGMEAVIAEKQRQLDMWLAGQK